MSPALGYRPQLDGVRAFAVALVVAVHVTYLLVPAWAGRWVPGGFLGVDVFFVLSGFLITTLLLEEHAATGTVSIRSFYARRALRLLPAVVVLLALHALAAVASGADLTLEAGTAAAVMLYVANWVIASGHTLAAGLGHLWSLSVEEQFYLLWPALLLLVLHRRRSTRVLVTLALAGIVFAAAVRAWLWVDGATWDRIYVRTDARADQLLMGVLLALAFHRGWRLPRRWRHVGTIGVLTLLVCAVAVPRDSGWLFVGGGFTVVGLAALAVLATVLDPGTALARAFSWRPAVHLGRASYSLYLWHAPVFEVVADRLGSRPAGVKIAVAFAGCTAATVASYRLVEMPMARLRRRWAPPRSAPGGEPVGPLPSVTSRAPAGAVAVVIVNYRTKELTQAAIASTLEEQEVAEVVVVDNASGDGSAAYLRQAFADDRIRVLESEANRGFGPAVNLGAAACQAPLLLILNSDATIAPGSLGVLTGALVADDEVGIVAPAVYGPDGRSLQPGAYGRLPTRRDVVLSSGWARKRADDPRYARAPGWVSGVAMLLRRADFVALGGFDEAFTMYLEDVDLCRRMHSLGKSVRREPSAAVVHLGGRSWRSPRDQRRRFHQSKLRYFEKVGAGRLELGCVRLAGAVRTGLARR